MPSLPQGEEKPAAVRKMFDRVAPQYDRVNSLMTLGLDQRWRRRVIRQLRLRPSDTVLDVACGTGDFAALALGRTPRVIGVDFSSGMLARAHSRLGGRAVLVNGDVLRLPLRSGSVTVAVCGFALRNVVAIGSLFAELARILAPGGRLALLEVDRPKNPVVRAGHSLYFDRLVPLVGRVLSDRAAYRYLPDSVAYLPPEEELLALLRSAGFSSVRKESYLLGAIQAITARAPA